MHQHDGRNARNLHGTTTMQEHLEDSVKYQCNDAGKLTSLVGQHNHAGQSRSLIWSAVSPNRTTYNSGMVGNSQMGQSKCQYSLP